jgi:hypothetical protein
MINDGRAKDVQVAPPSVERATALSVARTQNDEEAHRSLRGGPVPFRSRLVQLVPPSAVARNLEPVGADPTAAQCWSSVHDTVDTITPTGVLRTDQVVPRSLVRSSPGKLVAKHVVADTQSTSFSSSPKKPSVTRKLVHDAPPSVVRCGGNDAVMHAVGEPQLTVLRFDTVRGVDNTSVAVTARRAEAAAVPRSGNPTDAARQATVTKTA